MKEAVGEKHLQSADCLEGMAFLFMKMQQREEGKRLEQQSLDILEDNLGKNHWKYADRLERFREVFYEIG